MVARLPAVGLILGDEVTVHLDEADPEERVVRFSIISDDVPMSPTNRDPTPQQERARDKAHELSIRRARADAAATRSCAHSPALVMVSRSAPCSVMRRVCSN